MIDDRVSTIFTPRIFNRLGLNARLRKHEQLSLDGRLMGSNVTCGIIQPKNFLVIYNPVYSRTAVSTGKIQSFLGAFVHLALEVEVAG